MPADPVKACGVGGCVVSLPSDEDDPLEALARTPRRISELAGRHDGALLRNRLPRAAASVEEVIGHLLDTELAFSCSTWTSLQRESPRWKGGSISFWERLPKPPLEDLVRAFAAIREGNLLLLRPASVAEAGSGRAPDALPFELRMLAGHDHVHLQDIRVILDEATWTPLVAPPACRVPHLQTREAIGTCRKSESGHTTPRLPGKEGGSPG